MIEIQDRVRETIPEEIMLARLAQSEQMREFFIEVWKQNPSLAKQGGARVNNLMMPLEPVDSGVRFSESPAAPIMSKQRGVSLVELIMFIVIVSTAMIGILSVMNVVSKNSADPVIHKQTLAIAQSLLEEIELQDFSLTKSAATTRATYQNVMDYNGYTTTTGIVAPDTAVSPIAGLSAYNVLSTTVVGTALDSIPATSAVMITVTVKAPSGETIDAVGYRAAY